MSGFTRALINPVRTLLEVLNPKVGGQETFFTEYDLLFATCELVVRSWKIKLVKPVEEGADLQSILQKIAATVDIRVRKVALADDWWRNDCGPLLGFYQNRPCALLPKKNRGYKLVDLVEGRTFRISASVAKKLASYAYYFYPALPVNMSGWRDLWGFISNAIKDNFWKFAGVQAIISLLTLVIPAVSGYLFKLIVPNADVLMLWQLMLILLLNILVLFFLSIFQADLLNRLRFKMEAIIIPAIWDRILKFPLQLFRRFSAGDLVFRAEAVNELQNTLTQAALPFMGNAFTALLLLGLLFYYCPSLACAALGLALVMLIINIGLYSRQLFFIKRLYYHFGKFIGFVSEVLSGISKIRVADATGRVFSLWAERFAKRSQTELLMKNSLLRLDVAITFMTIFNPLMLYGLTALIRNQLDVGTFIGFYITYSLFFIISLKMSSDISDIIRLIPLWKRAKPVVTGPIEQELNLSEPGVLTGDIVVRHVTFRYHCYEKPLFKDLSITIRPGEFIALVGPSGSGKSSLLRLLLGFEQPEAGEILYNGINLKTLKLIPLRRQIGVVAQNSALIPGTVFTNIIGFNIDLTRRDAWEIAEKVGLTDLIKALPMQMDTLITEGLITLSGGEVQRLILARALAQNPRILFLDEATSALDNTTQAIIQNYLKQLQITQIIAAHRLSTIVNADRIYVLDKGSVVQSGTFSSLMAEPGLFAQLAKRQLT